jgi:amino acid adenylation domain-containing protein
MTGQIMTVYYTSTQELMVPNVIERLSWIADQHEHDLAVIMGDRQLTYGALRAASNQLAGELSSRGIGPGDVVGVVVERSPDLIVAILAVLKCGAAYAAIDPEYPPERVAQMCGAIQMALIITTDRGLGTRPPYGAPRVHLDRDRQRILARSVDFDCKASAPDDLAYVVFTSGSTGTPKAVAVHHGGWANLMNWFVSAFALRADDRCLIISSFGFDITQRAIVMPLLVGGQLHLCPYPTIDAAAVLNVIAESGITLLNCAPSAFYPLIEHSTATKAMAMRWLFLGGEPINAIRLRAWAEHAQNETRIANVYGTAECSDVSTYHILKHYAAYAARGVPAGFPIANTQIFVVDDCGRVVPPGEAGEIVICGQGVGKGYVNDPELTSRKFVDGPTLAVGPCYRTGDRGRQTPDWGLVFDGRTDYQVKIRGNRIDLNGVESLLRQDERVIDAVALKHSSSTDAEVLAAFILTLDKGDPEILTTDLRKSLSRRAPPFMVPSLIRIVDGFPLNPNGKTDRLALASLLASSVTSHAAHGESCDQTTSPVESEIIDIFARILNVNEIKVTDNFFDLGGYSALVTETVADINSSLDVGLSIYDFLTGPTARELAELIGTKKQTAT